MKADRQTYMDAVYAMDRVRYATPHLDNPPFHWQRDILRSTAQFKILNCARQSGKTTIIAVIPAWKARTKPRSWSIILASREDQAIYVMNKIKRVISIDPTYPALVRTSDRLLELDNGSRIQVIVAVEGASKGVSKPDVIIVDEAAQIIPDTPLTAGLVPMLTGNPDCEFLMLSTPFGRSGFFYRTWQNQAWERYYVRSPFTPMSSLTLEQLQTEDEFRVDQAKHGVRGYYSPRHFDLKEQLFQLSLLGPQIYRQEQCGEFVEPDSQLFSYSDIAKAFNKDGVQALKSGVLVRDDIQAFGEEDGSDNQ